MFAYLEQFLARLTIFLIIIFEIPKIYYLVFSPDPYHYNPQFDGIVTQQSRLVIALHLGTGCIQLLVVSAKVSGFGVPKGCLLFGQMFFSVVLLLLCDFSGNMLKVSAEIACTITAFFFLLHDSFFEYLLVMDVQLINTFIFFLIYVNNTQKYWMQIALFAAISILCVHPLNLSEKLETFQNGGYILGTYKLFF